MVENKYSLKHVQCEVSPGLVEWTVRNKILEFRREESKEQEHMKAKVKMHEPHHQSPPNAAEVLAPPKKTEISWKQNSTHR